MENAFKSTAEEEIVSQMKSQGLEIINIGLINLHISSISHQPLQSHYFLTEVRIVHITLHFHNGHNVGLKKKPQLVTVTGITIVLQPLKEWRAVCMQRTWQVKDFPNI